MSSVKVNRIYNRVNSAARQSCVSLTLDSDGGADVGTSFSGISSGFVAPKYVDSLFMITYHFGVYSSGGANRGGFQVIRRVYDGSILSGASFTDNIIWAHLEGALQIGIEYVGSFTILDRPNVTPGTHMEYILAARAASGTLVMSQPNYASGTPKCGITIMELRA